MWPFLPLRRRPRSARRRLARPGYRPHLEPLEARTLLDGVTVTIAEEQWPGNNTPATAFPLNLNWGGPNSYVGPRLQAGDADYYQFSTLRPPENGDTVKLSVLNTGNFPLVLHIAYWNGTQFVDVSNDPGRFTFAGDVTISLNNLPSTIFLLDVLPGAGFGGTMQYQLALDVPPILRDAFDAAAANNTFATASDLGTVSGYQFTDLTIHDMADRDFFRFTLPAPASDEHYFALDFEHYPLTDLGLALYDNAGTLLDIDVGPRGRHEVSLANLPAGNYRLEVFGDGGGNVTNPRYRLSSNAPRTAQADSFEANDTFAAARDLGTVRGAVRRGADRNQPTGGSFLSVHSPTDKDVFKFTIDATGGPADSVRIDFDHTAGDLDLLLYSGQTTPFLLDSSAGATNSERISLEGLPAGTYHAMVVGANGAINPSYTLTVHGPGGSATADQFDAVFSNNNRNRATHLGPVGGLRLLSAPDVNLSIGPNDQDWFAFELTQPAGPGHFVTAVFQHLLGDLDLQLYNGNGTLLASSTGNGDSESLNLAGLAAGTYFVCVYGFGGAANPQYALAINGSGPDRYDEQNPNNTAAAATNLRTVGGRFQELGLSVHSAADQDWFRFQTTATAGTGHQVLLDFEHAQGDLDLFLYDANGTTLLASSDGVSNGEEIDLGDVRLSGGGRGALPAGTYTVKVVGYAGETNPLYHLTIVAPNGGGADRYDRGGASNNNRAAAVDLRAFAAQDGTAGGLVVIGDEESPLSIHASADEDWFRLAVTGQETAAHFAAITFDHTQGDLDLELYRANETTPVRRSAGVGNRHEIDLANLSASDSYYLRVFGFNGGAGAATNPAYGLAVNLPEAASGDWLEARTGGPSDNNDRTRATDFGTLDRTLEREELSVHNSADEDWFRFQTLAAGGHGHAATIVFDHLQGDLELELYNQNGVLQSRSATVNDQETVLLDGLPAGTYFLRVVGRGTGATRARNPRYALRIDPPAGSGGDYAEPNNAATAPFDLREVRGMRTFEPLSIHAGGNDDWFRFTTTGAAVDGNTAGIRFDPRLGDLDLFLYDATGTRSLGESRTAQGVEEIALNAVNLAGGTAPLPAGTYLLRVAGHQNSTHPRYVLSIDAPDGAVPPDFAEANDTFGQAANLQRVEGVTALAGFSVHQAADQDWFVFQTTAAGVEGHRVEITFDHAEGDLQLALFTSNGTTLLEQSQGVSNREVVSLAGRAAGTYYVRVNGTGNTTNPSYGLTIAAPQGLSADFADRPTDNNDRSRAYNLRTLDGALSLGGLSIHAAADQDWYRFDLPRATTPGQTARIDFSHAEGNLKLELFPGTETVALATSDGTGNFEEVALRDASGNALPAGTYYVRVSGTGGATNPNYTLTLNTSPSVEADRYEPNDTLTTAYDLRDVSQLARSSASSSRFWDFGFGYDPYGFGGFGYDPYGFGGFGVFGGGFGFEATNPLFYDLSGGFNTGFFSGLDIPFGPGLGVGGLVGMELGFTNQFNNWAWQGANYLAQQIPNVPGAVESLGFGGWALSQTASDLSQIYSANNANWFVNSNAQLNAIGNFSNAILGYGLYSDPYGGLFQLPYGPDSYSGSYLGGFSVGFDPGAAFNFLPFRQGGTSSAATIDGLSLEANDPDYFRFELTQPGQEGQFVGLGFDHDLGDLKLTLLTWSGNAGDAGTRLDSSNGQGDDERVSLAGLPAGTYYLLVEGATASVSNPNYQLFFNTTAETAATGDLAESNDTAATAHDLRKVEGDLALSGLSIHTTADQDWFRFEIAAATTAADFVRIDFDQDAGDLDLELYRPGGSTPFRTSRTTGDTEEVALLNESGQPLTPGAYLLRVAGYAGATNPRYDLRLRTPSGTIAPDGLEPNNAPGNAVDLNTLDRQQLPELTIHAGDQDFFRLTVPAGRTLNHSHAVSVEFDAARGDLNLALLNGSGGTVLRTPSTANTGNEIISLDGLAAGTYLVRVTGASAATANRYTLYVDAPLQSVPATDDWTVLVYMTASDLAPFAFEDINEMEAAAAALPGSVNLLAFYDQSSAHQKFATGGGTQTAWGTTGRAVIRPDTNDDIIATPFDLGIGEKNTGNPTSLAEFLTWATAAAPARRYALIMWDHGAGVEGFNFDNADGTTADAMTAAELVSALQQVPAFRPDLLAFDSCNMAMTELADRFASLAGVLVASEENIPGTGYAYDTIFASLAVNPDLVGAAALASGIVESYENQYRGNAEACDTLSAVRTGGVAALTAALRAFTTAALAAGVTTAQFDVLRDARDSATSFLGHPEFRDLGQFMSFAAGATTLPAAIRTAAQGVLDALTSAVIARTSDQRETSGLSIVLPARGEAIKADYTSQFSGFLAATGWGDFLQRFVSGPTARPASLDPDFAEANEQAQRAHDLRTLTGPGHALANLSLHNRTDRDYFRFRTLAAGAAADQVTVTRDAAAGSWRVSLHDAQGAELDQRTGTGASLALPLSGRAAGRYLIRVTSTDGTLVPRYGLQIDAPAAAAGNDWAGNNSTTEKASDLGVIGGDALYSGLVIESGRTDWFAFQTPRNVGAAAQGRLQVVSTTGQALTVQLRKDGGTPATQTGNGTVTLPFDTATAFDYRLSVAGAAGDRYQIRFLTDEPAAPAQQLQLGASANSVAEHGGRLDVTVQRVNGSTGLVTVQYATGNGTATEGSDYTATSGTLTFAPGETSKTVGVTVLDDTTVENNETVTLTLSNPTGGATLGTPATATLTITDNDSATQPGQLQFGAATYGTGEGAGAVTVTVTRTNGSSGAVSVRYATSNGTATAGQDYTAASGTLTFAAGETSKTFAVPVTNDTTVENNETVTLTLSSPADGATLGTPTTATLTITDDDTTVPNPSELRFSVSAYQVSENVGQAVLTILRTGSNSRTVTVGYTTADGTARAGSDYTAVSGTLTIPAGALTATFSVPVFPDTLGEGEETVTVTLNNPGPGAVLLTPSTATLTVNDPLTADSYPANLVALANTLTHDVESYAYYITEAYRLYLKRLPDAGGLAFWVDQMKNKGVSDERLEATFLGSPEYIAAHGGTGEGWVIGMYQDLLGRDPDAGGLAYWTAQLAAGASPLGIAYGFAASAERAAQRITADYQLFLGRDLDQGGLNFWVNAFLNGAQNEDVVGGFVGSTEYYTSLKKGQSNRRRWVVSAFQDIFHRAPTDAELTQWLSRMN